MRLTDQQIRDALGRSANRATVKAVAEATTYSQQLALIQTLSRGYIEGDEKGMRRRDSRV